MLLSFSVVPSLSAYSQSAQFMRFEAESLRSAMPPPPFHSCATDLERASPFAKPFMARTGAAAASCDDSTTAIPLIQPCNPSSLRPTGCTPQRDHVQQSLDAGGKTGHKILQVRDRVLEILGSDNACAQWYRSKDPDPAATFRTLNFDLDRKGEDYVLETTSPGALLVFHSPYVARVIQGDGSYATVTINKHGAFFSALAKVGEQSGEGGPMSFQGVRFLKVGPYAGNTMQAQVLTLLHEFGHLLDLLPVDEGDRNGKSLQNSMEVLRYCRPEIESKGNGGTLLTSR